MKIKMETQQKSSYPLTFAKDKTKLRLERVKNNKEVVKHLENLGLICGTEFEIISRNATGLIIKLKGSKIALDGNLCKNIFVSELEQNEDLNF